MYIINPMTEEGIRPHVGKQVCAMMCDGTYYHGTITDVRDGHLFLNGNCNQNAYVCSAPMKSKMKSISKTKSISRGKTKPVSVSAFYPGYGYGYGYGYGAGLALSLGFLALLFLL